MSAKNRDPDTAKEMLNTNKIATLDELKTVLNTRSTMTVFRYLKTLDYLSSYSHRGKYYTLHRIAEFDDFGLWSFHSVWFSKYGNLIQTTKEFIDQSSAGFTANELESILHVEVKYSLLKLFESNRVHRERVSGRYLYLTLEPTKRKRQLSARKIRTLELDFDLSFEIEQLADELKAAIILFFSLLDEKQRRLFAGLESFKLGHGGDRKISQLFGMDVHTVAKGRKELFSETVQPNGIRKKGGGRKSMEKKTRRLSNESTDC